MYSKLDCLPSRGALGDIDSVGSRINARTLNKPSLVLDDMLTTVLEGIMQPIRGNPHRTPFLLV